MTGCVMWDFLLEVCPGVASIEFNVVLTDDGIKPVMLTALLSCSIVVVRSLNIIALM